MKIVIDISETLKKIADEEDIKTFSHFMWSMIVMDAIKNGTPLPKGHGDLKDADAIVNGFNSSDLDNSDPIENYSNACNIINSFPVIVPADKEDEG